MHSQVLRRFIAGDEHKLCTEPVPDAENPINKRSEFIEKFQDIAIQISQKMLQAYNKSKKYYDRNKINRDFKIGDTVFKRNFVKSNAAEYTSEKLCKKYIKCVVIEKISDLVYRLADERGKDLGKWHISHLKT